MRKAIRACFQLGKRTCSRSYCAVDKFWFFSFYLFHLVSDETFDSWAYRILSGSKLPLLVTRTSPLALFACNSASSVCFIFSSRPSIHPLLSPHPFHESPTLVQLSAVRISFLTKKSKILNATVCLFSACRPIWLLVHGIQRSWTHPCPSTARARLVRIIDTYAACRLWRVARSGWVCRHRHCSDRGLASQIIRSLTIYYWIQSKSDGTT